VKGLLGGRRRGPGKIALAAAGDPFAVLGLSPDADLSDDDVRAAWRRVATATHPDRADGGDPERFAVAAAAYTELRTRYGRGEARAALTPAARIAAGPPDADGPARRAGAATANALDAVGARVRQGRPVRAGLRLAAAAAATLAVLASSPGPAGPALVVGLLTWLALTIRGDLGPPPGG
jgi:hypothetical protein